MSQYMFGIGNGWLPEAANKIARKHGAQLINHTDPQCTCGWGCKPYACKQSRRHWFVCPNYGQPFNQEMASALEAELRDVRIGMRA